LKELAAALDNDADYAATIQKQLATKANVTDVYTKLYIDNLISNYFTKQEINDKLDLKLNASVINNYYNKLYIDDLISNYYTKTQSYTRTEIDDRLDLKLNVFNNK
jgi:hypothetical protein